MIEHDKNDLIYYLCSLFNMVVSDLFGFYFFTVAFCDTNLAPQ